MVGVCEEQEYEVMVDQKLVDKFVGNAPNSVIALSVCFGAFQSFLAKQDLLDEFLDSLDDDEKLALLLGFKIYENPELYEGQP
jgi:hypothetical protein